MVQCCLLRPEIPHYGWLKGLDHSLVLYPHGWYFGVAGSLIQLFNHPLSTPTLCYLQQILNLVTEREHSASIECLFNFSVVTFDIDVVTSTRGVGLYTQDQ